MKGKHAKIGPALYNGIADRNGAAIIAQLRTGHCGLNRYLHRFNIRNSPYCQCGYGKETVEHYLLECRQYREQRKKLRGEVGRGKMRMEILLEDPKTINPRRAHRTASTLPVIPEDTTASSLPSVGNTTSPEPSVGSDGLQNPSSDHAKLKSWSPAQVQTILEGISSTEFEKSTTGKYSTKRVQQQLNSFHRGVNEIPPLYLPVDSSLAAVIIVEKAILQTRLESLSILSIPATKSRILTKAHAKSGIRAVSLRALSVQVIMKVNLSPDEMLTITSKESLLYT